MQLFVHQKATMDEKVILQHLKGGSREALSLLWQAHSANVLNLAFRMMKDRDEAEDILMDVFVQAPKAVQGFRGESALGTWLYRLTVNTCLMKLRAQKRHRELEEEKLDTIVEEVLGKDDAKNESFDAELLEKGLGNRAACSGSKTQKTLMSRTSPKSTGCPKGPLKQGSAAHVISSGIF